jgi:heme exporter protein D
MRIRPPALLLLIKIGQHAVQFFGHHRTILDDVAQNEAAESRAAEKQVAASIPQSLASQVK